MVLSKVNLKAATSVIVCLDTYRTFHPEWRSRLSIKRHTIVRRVNNSRENSSKSISVENILKRKLRVV
jgi:hypothetical protein